MRTRRRSSTSATGDEGEDLAYAVDEDGDGQPESQASLDDAADSDLFSDEELAEEAEWWTDEDTGAQQPATEDAADPNADAEDAVDDAAAEGEAEGADPSASDGDAPPDDAPSDDPGGDAGGDPGDDGGGDA